MHKVSRSQFYEYKRSFQEFGLEGLIDKPPIPGPHLKQMVLLKDSIKLGLNVRKQIKKDVA